MEDKASNLDAVLKEAVDLVRATIPPSLSLTLPLLPRLRRAVLPVAAALLRARFFHPSLVSRFSFWRAFLVSGGPDGVLVPL